MVILREILGTRPAGSPRPLVQAAAIVAIGVLLLSLNPRPSPPNTTIPDAHAWLSLTEAVNATFCRKPGYTSSSIALPAFLAAHPEVYGESLRDVVGSQAGTLDAYCRTLTAPTVNNENSLMALMVGVLKLEPGASLVDLGVALNRVRVALWVLFAIILSWSGASVLLTIWTLYLGAALRGAAGADFSVHPFLAVLPLAMAAFYVVAFRPVGVGGAGVARSGVARSGMARSGMARSSVLIALVAGGITAFSANLRTSYLPIYFAFFILWLCMMTSDLRRTRGPSRGIWQVPMAALLMYGLAYLVTDRALVRAALPASAASLTNYAHHPIVHPIVLGVAIPSNDFARQMGITWDDGAAIELAQRVDPNVIYLGPGYERALARYYWSLWHEHPAAMARLYLLKIQQTGHGLFEALSGAGIFPGLTWQRARRLDHLAWGSVLFAVTLTLAAATCWSALRHRSRLMLIVALLSIAACAILVESAIVMPTFKAIYHVYLLFYFSFVPVFVAEIAIDTLYGASAACDRPTA